MPHGELDGPSRRSTEAMRRSKTPMVTEAPSSRCQAPDGSQSLSRRTYTHREQLAGWRWTVRGRSHRGAPPQRLNCTSRSAERPRGGPAPINLRRVQPDEHHGLHHPSLSPAAVSKGAVSSAGFQEKMGWATGARGDGGLDLRSSSPELIERGQACGCAAIRDARDSPERPVDFLTRGTPAHARAGGGRV